MKGEQNLKAKRVDFRLPVELEEQNLADIRRHDSLTVVMCYDCHVMGWLGKLVALALAPGIRHPNRNRG